jgi:hypothetical protein
VLWNLPVRPRLRDVIEWEGVPSNRAAVRFLDILDNIRLIQCISKAWIARRLDADSRTRDAV